MTRPIGEPSIAKEQGSQDFGIRQLFRRPAPITEGGATVVNHLYSWNYDTDPAVPNVTWTPIGNFASGGGFFEQTFVSPTGSSAMTANYQTGTIQLNDDAEYMLHAWVQFNEDAQVNNEKRFIAFNFGSSDRQITEFVFDTADGAIAQHKLHATAHRLLQSGTASPQLEVWQNSGGDLTIRDASYLARRFELYADGTDTLNDPFA